MTTKVEYGWIDNSNERTRSTLYFVDVDPLTNPGLAALGTGVNAVRTALDTVTLLNETEVSFRMILHTAAPTPPASVLAQRETGLRLSIADTVTGDVQKFDLPGADWTVYRTSGTDVADLTKPDLAALKTAIETHCVSKAGNTVVVASGHFYGKNN